MTNHFKKSIIRVSFESLVDQLKAELDKEGFEISGTTDFQQVFMDKLSIHFKKYKVLAAHIPHLYQEMMLLASIEGIVLPCNITIVELYPGEVAIVPVNPTELIVSDIQNASLQNLAGEVSRRLALAIHELGRESTGSPDLVTSWD
jgi:uncharacterized protein (DUF302 family)